MKSGVGFSDVPDSAVAGKQASEKAINMAGRTDPCDIVLLFCTARHNQTVLREVVSSVVGNSVPIYGGGAAGIITNESFGYAGDQVGVACLWLDGSKCDAFTDGGLLESEEDVGYRLGRDFARLGITPVSPIMLLYDAVTREDDNNVRLMMATRILTGMKNALGFLPDLAGAGMMGDHACSPTNQYIGQSIGKNYAIAFAFSEDIHMESVIMHGCHPASMYFTVTKADGPMILEIDRKPALTYMNELLGNAIIPEQYPFFLLFGINFGERWGDYDEDKYASRLCLGIDRERDGIIMFEPDMVEGTEFQIMFRTFNLDYMRPKIESLFENLNGREPVFAMYIDCAGRCAGYGGTDMEDALILQQTVAGRVPVLGIYTGVEIASVAGRPMGLDWTGVFCLFSRNVEFEGEKTFSSTDALVDSHAGPTDVALVDSRAQAGSTDAVDYSKYPNIEVINRLCMQNVVKILDLDIHTIALRYELELKRRGFHLISELAVSLRQMNDYESMFIQIAQRVNSALNMQKTLVLLSNGKGMFIPSVLQGFSLVEKERLSITPVRLPEELLSFNPVIVTPDDSPTCFSDIIKLYGLPYFIASPIILQGEVAALIMTGRLVEQPPYFTRLAQSDLETVHSITELLGSVLIRLRLHDITRQAETDGLTGLWNRNTFQSMVEDYLDGDNTGAFMMIDIDFFKSVNDTYGHLVGDNVLKTSAAAMRNVLRESDIIGRQGGDEFVVFCRGIKNREDAINKAVQIQDAWRSIIPEGATTIITASIGVSMSPRHGSTFRELYNSADAALYIAKKRGRDCFVLFE